MRSDPAEYELVAPKSLSAVVSLLADQPGQWLPIAGGTDVMVQYAAGKLASRRLVSLWNLPELRRIGVSDDEISVGSGCTYTDLRRHAIVEREFPLLASAARWTGGIANQNRGTLGGNIVNASPAADSLPALLVYEAELILVSARGERRVRYLDFHTGYKQTLLAADELIRAVCLRRLAGYLTYARKVGARNVQAISKVCVAALGCVSGDVIEDVRIAVGSVAPVPMRLQQTEQLLKGKTFDAALFERACETARGEVRPIDDIRSTARYRAAVVGNLVAEFLRKITEERQGRMSYVLARWNRLSPEEAAREILDCCGSSVWSRQLAAGRPFHDDLSLIMASDQIWNRLPPEDWMEALSKHPRIGQQRAPQAASAQSAVWSAEEQQGVTAAGESIQSALAEANREYEQRFGRVFIVCATGKSAREMLEILRSRLRNDDATELRVAAEEQRKIMNIRLQKWLQR